jgi:hypothetical protein
MQGEDISPPLSWVGLFQVNGQAWCLIMDGPRRAGGHLGPLYSVHLPANTANWRETSPDTYPEGRGWDGIWKAH